MCSKFVLPSFDFIIQDSASREIVESTSYTLKEINTVTSCSIYSAAALCTPDVWNLVEEVWGRAYVNTDVLFLQTLTPDVHQVHFLIMSVICVHAWLYAYLQSKYVFFNTGTLSKKLTPCVTVIVLGFFAPDDEIKEQHFNFDAQECKQNYFVGTENELFTFLIKHWFLTSLFYMVCNSNCIE